MVKTDNPDQNCRSRELIYVILVQNTTTPMRLSMNKKVVQGLLQGMKQESYFMVGVLCSKKDLWITKEGPIRCSRENLKLVEDETFKAMEEFSNRPEQQIEVISALKAVLELKFQEVKSFPRSVILVGQGSVDYQKDIENLIATSIDKHDSRISTIGIGNGTSDSFLRTIPLKAGGLFEIINENSDVEKKMELFMKRLRMPRIKDVKFHWSHDSNIAFLLPLFKPKQSLLKGTPIEVYVYFKKQSQGPHLDKPQTVKMTFFDFESSRDSSVTLMMVPYKGPIEQDVYRVVINQLLLNEAEIETASKEESDYGAISKEFIAYCGGKDWASTLAVENQIMCKHTSYLAVPYNCPKGFDIMKGDVKLLNAEDENMEAKKKFVVPNVVAAEFLNTNNALTATTSTKNVLKESLSVASFSSRKFNLVNQGMRKLQTSSTNSCSHAGLSDRKITGTEASEREDTETIDSMDQTDLLNQLLEDDDDEIDSKLRPTPSQPTFGKAKESTDLGHQSSSPTNRNKKQVHSLDEIEEENADDGTPRGVKEPSKVFSEQDEKLSPTSQVVEVKDIPRLLAEKVKADGTFDLDEKLFALLRITQSQVKAIAEKFKVQELDVIVTLATIYFKGQEFIAKFQITTKYLSTVSGVKKLPIFENMKKEIDKELRAK